MFLVCDGGGTKTDFLLFSRSGQVFAESKKVGTNAVFLEREKTVTTVIDGIEECLEKADIKIHQIEKIVLFIPGFTPCIDKVKKYFKREDIILRSDEDSAFYASFGAPYGITILSGTGSFAYGRNHAGKIAQAGGWGPLLGDEGSGYHIGLLCLKKLTNLYDNKIKDTMLERETLKHLNINAIKDLRKEAYKQDFTREKIASLTYVVKKCADTGDEFAQEILTEAATALAELAATVSSLLDKESLPVALIGGTCNMGKCFIQKVQQVLIDKAPNLIFQKGLYSPITGAALCVLSEYEHIKIDQNIATNLENKRMEITC